MKLALRHLDCASAGLARRTQGSGILVVLVLMGIMAGFIVTNANTLHTLKQELKRVERQQQKHLERPAAR